MIPIPNTRGWFVLASFLILPAAGYACGRRVAEGEAIATHEAQAQRYAIERARNAERIVHAQQQAQKAEQSRDSAIAATDKAIARVKRPTGVTVRPVTDSFVRTDLVDVCITSDSACYPAHHRVAALVAAQDSALHEVVNTLIPAVLEERRATGVLIADLKTGIDLRDEAIGLRDFRIQEQALTIRTLTPGKWQKRVETVENLGLLLGGIYLGVRLARMVPR